MMNPKGIKKENTPTNIAESPSPSIKNVPILISMMSKIIPSRIQCHHVNVSFKSKNIV